MQTKGPINDQLSIMTTTQPQPPPGYCILDPSKDGPKRWDDICVMEGETQWRQVSNDVNSTATQEYRYGFVYARRIESSPTIHKMGDWEGLPSEGYILVWSKTRFCWTESKAISAKNNELYSHWQLQPPSPPKELTREELEIKLCDKVGDYGGVNTPEATLRIIRAGQAFERQYPLKEGK